MYIQKQLLKTDSLVACDISTKLREDQISEEHPEMLHCFLFNFIFSNLSH